MTVRRGSQQPRPTTNISSVIRRALVATIASPTAGKMYMLLPCPGTSVLPPYRTGENGTPATIGDARAKRMMRQIRSSESRHFSTFLGLIGMRNIRPDEYQAGKH